MVKEESIFHILKECEVTKNELRIEKFRGRRQRSGNNEKDRQGRKRKRKGKQRGRRILSNWMFKMIIICITYC